MRREPATRPGRERTNANGGAPEGARAALALALLVLLGATAAAAHQKQRAAEPSPPAVTAAAATSLGPESPDPFPATDDDAPRFLGWIGRLHPSLVHFPISLLIAAAVAELLLKTSGAELFRHASRFCIWGGALGAVIAAPLGWLAAGASPSHETWLVDLHRWSGTAAAAWALLVLALCERATRRAAQRGTLRGALAIGAALVIVAGFLGSSLVHGIDHLAWWRA